MSGTFLHKGLADGRWFELSFMEQLGNIGSEVSRARKAQGEDEIAFRGATDRALELFNLTLADPRWRGGRLKEIGRAREVFCDAMLGGKEYHSTFADLDRYFTQFALVARG